jgi:hypothetical protein
MIRSCQATTCPGPRRVDLARSCHAGENLRPIPEWLLAYRLSSSGRRQGPHCNPEIGGGINRLCQGRAREALVFEDDRFARCPFDSPDELSSQRTGR